jgi:DNA-binding NarL/FixJ family response regulator
LAARTPGRGVYTSGKSETWMPVKDTNHSNQTGQRSLKVFLIEDNVVLRNIIVDALRDISSIEILFYADNELSATNWLSSNDSAWDLAVVDLHLKKGSGVGALSWCTTRRPGQQVVVLSGELTEDMRQKCLALRADAVFDKSTEMDDFLDYCKSLAV